MAKLHFRPYIP